LPSLKEICKSIAIPEQARPYLERMELNHPKTFRETLLQRAVVYALACVDAI
jgi:hypothetical protein